MVKTLLLEFGRTMVQITAGLWVKHSDTEAIQKPELRDLAQTYGKFWCTWQVDRGECKVFSIYKIKVFLPICLLRVLV